MAAPTLYCFYAGTMADFVADAASATSNQGTFTPGSSGATTLNGALTTAGMIPNSPTPSTIVHTVPVVAGSTANPGPQAVPGFIWTFYANGLV
jgi:hypothetical protein